MTCDVCKREDVNCQCRIEYWVSHNLETGKPYVLEVQYPSELPKEDVTGDLDNPFFERNPWDDDNKVHVDDSDEC